MNKTSFPESIQRDYWVAATSYGNGESEWTIPLGSWRKGRGLAGSRGHVYIHGAETAGVWLIRANWRAWLGPIQATFPNLVVMQDGYGECTFRVPMTDLGRLLPALGAKRRRRATEKQVESLARARELSPIGRIQRPV